MEPSQSARGPRRSDPRARSRDPLANKSIVTTSSGDNRFDDHFLDDQPQTVQQGVSTLLPKAATSEERERLLWRLEMCAKAREETTKIMSIRFAQRDVVKHEMRRERQLYLDELNGSQRDRDERWSRKLQRSPFAVDLLAENQRIDEEHRVQRTIETRRQRKQEKKNRHFQDHILQRATNTNAEIEELRAQKRQLLENEKQLRALRDVERSNARTALILEDRHRRQVERELQQLASAPIAPRGNFSAR